MHQQTHMEFDGTFGGYLKHMRYNYLAISIYLYMLAWLLADIAEIGELLGMLLAGAIFGLIWY
jgi:hypothetical protein